MPIPINRPINRFDRYIGRTLEKYINYIHNQINEKFTIVIFGITNNGYSISIKVEDFEPYFYIYLPEINKVIKILKVKKNECAYIGDTYIDFQAAKKSKIDF